MSHNYFVSSGSLEESVISGALFPSELPLYLEFSG